MSSPDGDRRMVVRRQGVADVVDQRAQHVLLVAPVGFGAGGGLQRVLEPADGEASVVAFEQPELVDHVLSGHRLRQWELADDLRPLLLGGVLEPGEGRPPVAVVLF